MPSEAKKKAQQKKKDAAKARQTVTKPIPTAKKTETKKPTPAGSENVQNGVNGAEDGALAEGNSIIFLSPSSRIFRWNLILLFRTDL